MVYRTRTYIAGDWDGDQDLISKLYEWNDSNSLGLHFVDAHDLTQARDTSLRCSIKKSLAQRLNASKMLVLIVGNQTNSLTQGSCVYCRSYNSKNRTCARSLNVDYRSYIQYECEKADRDELKIVAIYNATKIERSNCPEVLRYKGIHIRGHFKDLDGRCYWNYGEIKEAIMDNGW